MAKDIGKTVSTYAKNLGKHLKRLATRKEDAGDVLKGIAGDSRKLKRAIQSNRGPYDHQSAAKLLERGRKHYNEKDFARAEECFRKAILMDAEYALAHTYMGNVMYKKDLLREAVTYWTKAIDLAPFSDAAVKAESKLRRVNFKRDAVIQDLEDSVKAALGRRGE
ncbi:MAG: hypothetical protein AMXMBFR84_30810 [Candidatus Hydrogenedentota bacterium]